MNQIISVMRYEYIWDARRFKTYILIGTVLFISVSFSYLIPKYANGAFTDFPGGSLSWMFSTQAMFTNIAIGFSAMITGGLMTTDTISYELDRGTMLRIASMPMSRNTVFLGKVLEKLLMSVIFSILAVSVSLFFSSLLYGAQTSLEWVPAEIAGIALLYMSYASVGLLLGTKIRQSSMVFGVVFGLWIVSLVSYGFVAFDLGFNVLFDAIPYLNSAQIPQAIYSVAATSGGVIKLNFFSLGSSHEFFTLSSWSYMRVTAISSLVETVLILAAASLVFSRARIKVE